MKLSSYKSADQGRLFDEPLIKNDGKLSLGYCRHLAGELCEQLTAAVFNGRRHKTDSTCDYCPDVSITGPRGTIYFESKAVGLTKTVFIYEGRLRKDFLFARRHELYYVVWHHLAYSKLATTVNELRSFFSRECHALI